MIPNIYESVTMDDRLPMRLIHLDSTNPSKSEMKIDIDHLHFVPPHWHRSIEFTYVAKGTMCLRMGERVEIFKEDEFLFVNSGDIHELSNVPGTEVEVICFIISFNYLKEIEPGFESLRFDVKNETLHHRKMVTLFRSIVALYDNHESMNHLLIRSKLDELLYYLFKYFRLDSVGVENQKHIRSQNISKQILEYVHLNYNEPLSLVGAAKQFHMSTEHFARIFKDAFGKSFLVYLIDYRIYRAFPDIVHSDKSIETISSEQGFPSSKSMIKHFSDRYNMTPFAYRKQNKIVIIDHNSGDTQNSDIGNIKK